MYFIRLRPNKSQIHAIRIDRLNVFKVTIYIPSISILLSKNSIKFENFYRSNLKCQSQYAITGYGNNSSSRYSTSNNSQHKPKPSQNSNHKQHEKVDNKNEKNIEDNKKYRRALDHQTKDDLVDGTFWSEPVGTKKKNNNGKVV